MNTLMTGKKIDNADKIIELSVDRTFCRVVFYECKHCTNLQIYDHDAGSITHDIIGKPLTEEDQCYGCGAEAEDMKAVSVYEVEN